MHTDFFQKILLFNKRYSLTTVVPILFAKVLHILFYIILWCIDMVLDIIIRCIRGFFAVIAGVCIYPFRSFQHFWRFIILSGGLFILLIFLLLNIGVIHETYGLDSAMCFFTNRSENDPVNKVVRIVGDESEGSGFFVADNKILTNMHVIEGEPSPKVIFPDGHFVSPIRMSNDPLLDLAMLEIPESHPELIMKTASMNDYIFPEGTPLFAYGYPMGVDLLGEATMARGRYITTRAMKDQKTFLIQTDISLVNGMSGGPLTDYCGRVVGINTLSVAGLSMFIPIHVGLDSIDTFSDTKIAKIEFYPEESPVEAVKAFYSYLMLHRMQDGYNLLSSSYQRDASYDEWSNRFIHILSVYMVDAWTDPSLPNSVHVKFVTRNWNSSNIRVNYYEGTWKTVHEDHVYKLDESHILEAMNPNENWFQIETKY